MATPCVVGWLGTRGGSPFYNHKSWTQRAKQQNQKGNAAPSKLSKAQSRMRGRSLPKETSPWNSARYNQRIGELEGKKTGVVCSAAMLHGPGYTENPYGKTPFHIHPIKFNLIWVWVKIKPPGIGPQVFPSLVPFPRAQAI